MILQTKVADPLFTNDAAGYARALFIYAMAMTPIFGTVVWFLRRGPDQAIATLKSEVAAEVASLKSDITNLGRKVDDMGKDVERDRERAIALQREIADGHREVVDMLNTSGQAIQENIHRVDLRLARIEERSDIAGCFEKFGDQIVSAMQRNG